jgi:hypothetical protein|tara:strand:- start:743 stop:1162 length:420 start_codon:yes stop_codon:yes gene_type:complete
MSDEEIIKEEAKEEEEVQEKPVSNTWSMDDLVSLTDEVQETFVLFRDKEVHFQFSELVEKEEPKFKPISDRASDEEKMAFYSDVGSKRILAMLSKANERNPEGPLITKEHWELLPTTLRYQISNKIMGIEQESRENFPF